MLKTSQESPLKNVLQEKQVQILPGEEGKYTKLLNSFNMPIKEDLIQALKVLDIHGIHLNKENIIQYMSTKNQLNELVQGLNYDTALQLIDKDVDLEKDSLQEVVNKLEEAKKEEKPFSLKEFIRNLTPMSTEEAEDIAQQLYGNKQGKDIIDIIKALHKSGMEITKKNIDRVNDVFNKLHNIKTYDDGGLVEVIKNNIEPNIDHLYKIKNSIKKGAIAIEEKLSQYASRVYDRFTNKPVELSEKDLRLLEENIKELLENEGIKTTKEDIDLSKSLIKQGMAVSKENIDKVQQLKDTINELVKTLDQDKIALLLKAGIDVEKEKITKLLSTVKEIQSMEVSEGLDVESQFIKGDDVKDILLKIKKLGEAKEEELLFLLKKGEDFKLKDLHRVKFSSSTNLLPEERNNEVHQATIKMVGIFNEINKVNINDIVKQLKSNLPMTLEGLASTIVNSGQEDAVVKSIGIKNTENVRNEAQMIFKHMNFIKASLSSSMIAVGVEKDIRLEKMELVKLTGFINEYKMSEGKWELINALPQIQQQGENLLATLMKNNMPINLNEMKQVSQFMQNQQQLGHQLQEIFDFLQKETKESVKAEIMDIKNVINEISKELKNGKVDLNRFHEEISKVVKDLESKGNYLKDKPKEEFNKSLNRLTETIDTQNALNQKDTVVQLPYMMDNQIKNLQIYVMNEKQGGRKIDPQNMSVLLNMDTNNMGNINVYLGVNYKQLTLKVGVKYKEYQEMIEPQVPALKEMLSKIGYEIKEISFRVDEDLYLMSMVEEMEEKQKGVKHSIDMMI